MSRSGLVYEPNTQLVVFTFEKGGRRCRRPLFKVVGDEVYLKDPETGRQVLIGKAHVLERDIVLILGTM